MSAPNGVGNLDDAGELSFDLVHRHRSDTSWDAREPALRREAEPIELDEFGRLFDAALLRVDGFDGHILGGHKAKDGLLGFRQMAQRTEIACARGVVLKEEAVDIKTVEHALRDGFVAWNCQVNRAKA